MGNIACQGLYLFAILALLAAIPLVIYWIVKRPLPRFFRFLRTPKSTNLKLSYTPLHNDEVFLKVCNRELRRRFLLVYASVRYGGQIPDRQHPVDNMGIYGVETLDGMAYPQPYELKWRLENTANPIEVHTLKCRELSFIQLDAVNNEFHIKVDGLIQYGFKAGMYKFTVTILGIETDRMKHPMGHRLMHDLDAIVDYKGSNRITMEIKKHDQKLI